ncbi:hypothetical protein FRC01_005913, partial [Tulasnella sp. 417]
TLTVYDDFEPIDGDEPTLPADDEIIAQCRAANRANLAKLSANPQVSISGVELVGAPDGRSFWVKFGPNVSLAEARTQHYVAQQISKHNAATGGSAPVRVPAVYRFLANEYKGYIVMDFVNGQVCTNTTRTITAPHEQLGCPGPVGGGWICHNFFIDRMSPVQYPTVESLANHINGILKHENRTERVDFGPEVSRTGLRLCLSDLTSGNFMRDDNKIVAIDFEASCFLPISFFEMALGHHDSFTRFIRPFVKRPESTQGGTLDVASSLLVKYQDNKIGLPVELL